MCYKYNITNYADFNKESSSFFNRNSVTLHCYLAFNTTFDYDNQVNFEESFQKL